MRNNTNTHNDKLLTHLSGCQCFESNHPTLFTQGALSQLSPPRGGGGGYIEGVLFANNTAMDTHVPTRAPTNS